MEKASTISPPSSQLMQLNMLSLKWLPMGTQSVGPLGMPVKMVELLTFHRLPVVDWLILLEVGRVLLHGAFFISFGKHTNLNVQLSY